MLRPSSSLASSLRPPCGVAVQPQSFPSPSNHCLRNSFPQADIVGRVALQSNGIPAKGNGDKSVQSACSRKNVDRACGILTSETKPCMHVMTNSSSPDFFFIQRLVLTSVRSIIQQLQPMFTATSTSRITNRHCKACAVNHSSRNLKKCLLLPPIKTVISSTPAYDATCESWRKP